MKNWTDEKVKKLYTFYILYTYYIVKKQQRNIFCNGEITSSFIPRDKFANTAVSFSISKEIKKRYGFILLLGK